MFWTQKTGVPNFTPRLALQLLGTDVMRDNFHEDIWLSSLEYRLRCVKKKETIVISDARFVNELDLIKKMGGKIVWVQRGDLPEWYTTATEATGGNVLSEKLMSTKYSEVHRSEWDWAGYPVDRIITNDGTLNNLEQKVTSLIEDFRIPSLKSV